MVLKPLKDFLNAATTSEDLNWAVRLSPDVPLDLEINTLGQDIDGLRERVDNLESLSGRIGELESEVDGLILEIGGLGEAVEGIRAEIAEFADHAERFQSFLEGLGDLVDSLVAEPQEVP